MGPVGRIALIGLAATLVACAAPSAAPIAPSAADASPVNTPHVVTLELVARPGVTARASAHIEVGDVGYTIIVTATDLAPNSSSFVNMHMGTCALEQNDAMVLVGSIASDAQGQGTVSHYFLGRYTVPTSGRILTLHGPSRGDLDRIHIACVDMTG